jgi:carotenoid cleavage dioxygenase
MHADPAAYHWFTGDGMVHGIRLRDGRAEWYRNRWVRNERIAEELGEADPGGPRTEGMDSAPNTNVIGHAGRTFALVEAGSKPVELDDELRTVSRCDFDGTLPNGFTAHPKLDPVTGELHTANYFWARPDTIEYAVVGPQGRVTRREDLAVPGSPMVHDMSITERYAVFYDLPVTFDLDAAMSGASFPYTWNPDHGARLGVLPRGGTGTDALRWFEVEPCYVFHPVNAYDEVASDGTERIVLDVIRHDRVFDRSRLGPDESRPTWWRWTIDLGVGGAGPTRVTETQVDDVAMEFPRVDERLVGRRHRYGFAAGLRGHDADPGVSFDGARIICRDTESDTLRAHELGPGRAAGEAVFVPASPEAEGLDGHLMTLVYDAATERSDLVILSAEDIEGGPVATVHLPQRVPYGFHGNWVPTA